MHIPRTLTFRGIEKDDLELKSLKLRNEIVNFKEHFTLNCYFIFEKILLIKLFFITLGFDPMELGGAQNFLLFWEGEDGKCGRVCWRYS